MGNTANFNPQAAWERFFVALVDSEILEAPRVPRALQAADLSTNGRFCELLILLSGVSPAAAWEKGCGRLNLENGAWKPLNFWKQIGF